MSSHPSEFPTMTLTAFFRGESSNIDLIVANVLPNITPELGKSQTMNIAHVGCSSGEETWVLAALCAARGRTNFHIDAIDANPEVLEEARNPRKTLARHVLQKMCTREYPFPVDSLDWITQVDADTIQLDSRLASKIDYQQRNVLDQGMPESGAYDLAVVNNVFFHYRNMEMRNRLFGNVAGSLTRCGLMTTEPSWNQDYLRWMRSQARTHNMTAVSAQSTILQANTL